MILFIFTSGSAGFAMAYVINYLLSDYIYEFVKVIIGIIFTVGTIIGGFIILEWLGFMEGHRGRPRFTDDERADPRPVDEEDFVDRIEHEHTQQLAELERPKEAGKGKPNDQMA